MLNTNPFGFNTPQELNSLPSTELNWQNKFTGKIADLFKNSLNQSGKLSSYLGRSFEENNLTGIGESVGKMLQGDFKGGLNSAVKGLGIDKGITQGMSGVAKGITRVGNVAGLANTALDIFGVGQIDRRTQSTGSKGLETFNKYSGVLMGTPFAPLATIGALAGGYDKLAAGKADEQGTADMSNIGYATVVNPLAGATVGGWDRLRGKRGKINQVTKQANRDNMGAYDISRDHKQNMLASQNTTGVLQDRNYQQMMGGYGTNILAARLGTKVPPVNLKKIANKAVYNFEQKNKFKDPILGQKGSKILPPPSKRTSERKNKDGTVSTHLYVSGESDGKFVVYPTIFQNDKGEYYEPKDAFREAIKRGELLEFDIDEEAKAYAKGAWKDHYNYDGTSKKYKDGGLLTKADKKEVIEEVVEEKMNVIPEGAFHSRKNNLPEEIAAHVTHKGIPVITEDGGKIVQHAEVERNEIIFHKEATNIMEDLYKKYKEADSQKEKDQLMIECGKYVANQILINTDDRTGIIEDTK